MLQLSDREWAEFKVGDLFNIFCGKVTTVDKSGSKFPIVSACTTNNAIIGYTDDESKLLNGNCLTIGQQTAFCTYQENKFVATNNVDVLVPIDIILNKNTGLFLCTVINNEINGKFNYGRKLSASRAVEVKINLPITQSGIPDYQFMHDYIAEREPDYSWATQCIEPNAELSLTDREWAEFRVGDLFNIKTGKAYNKNKINVADKGLRHISRATSNHGIDCYINLDSIDGIVTYEGNCVTVSSIPYTDGTCAFYQDKIFCCGVGVNIITHELMTPELGQFLCTCINHAVVGKYGMARSLSINMLKDEIINLPITQDGTPDYDFMERYIKSLPFSKVLEA